MTQRTRRLLTLFALAIVLLSLAALLYATWPVETLRVQATVPPVILTPP